MRGKKPVGSAPEGDCCTKRRRCSTRRTRSNWTCTTTSCPPIARTTVDASLLLERITPAHRANGYVFAPVDQLLHSAAHLFLDAEPRERVRDLVDMDGLRRHFGAKPGFWEELPARAAQLGLSEPLAPAAHFLRRWFETPAPETAWRQIERQGPGPLGRAWLLPVLTELLTPSNPDGLPPRLQNAAATVVLARYHMNRMPLRLLIPHLWHKRRSGPSTAAPTGADVR